MVQSNDPRLIAFESVYGWCGLEWMAGQVTRFSFGFCDLKAVESHFQLEQSVASDCESRWAEQLASYFQGAQHDLMDIPVNLDSFTDFQTSVLLACRNIRYGSTLTYGQLATAAGSPQAARAVGSVMSGNRVPIIIPCHRVVSAKGLGLYSAGQGASTKEKLLQLEGATKDVPGADQYSLFGP